MAREFVSGAFRSNDEFKPPHRDIAETVNDAITKKRQRKRLHQRYNSELTPQIRKNTRRMLGEAD